MFINFFFNDNYNNKDIFTEIGQFEIFPINLFDCCYLSTEIFLFFSLTIILLQYSLQMNKIIRLQHYFLQNTIDERVIESFLILNRKLNIGLIIIINKTIKILKICLLLLLLNPIGQVSSKYLLGGFLVTTPAIVFLKIIILFSAIIILRSNLLYFIIENNRNGDFIILFGFIIFSFLLFLQVADFFILFFFLEIIAILFYIIFAIQKSTLPVFLNIKKSDLTKYQKFLILAGLGKENNFYSILTAIIYFILNAIITALFLFVLSSFFIVFQTTNFLMIAGLLMFKINNLTMALLLVSFICLLFVFFFKLSIVPFHWWIPAVFEGAPYISIMFLAIPFKLCSLFILIKILYLIFTPLFFIWQPILYTGSLLSMLVGTIGLFFQVKLKKFWAYSTINHMGYIFLALSTNSWLGIRACLIYFFAYILMNFGFFIMCLILTNDSLQQRIVYLNQLLFFKNFKYSLTAFSFSIILFSLIGIPPLFGFWSKFFVLTCVLTTFKTHYLWLSLMIIILTSLIATVSYLRIWKIIFIEEPYMIYKKDFQFYPITIANIKFLFVCIFGLIFGPIIFQGNINFYLDSFIASILLNIF